MRLKDISIKNLLRRKGRTLFLLIGLTLGIASFVSLTSIAAFMEKDISKKLDEFGANILVTPKSDTLFLSYAGIEVSFSAEEKFLKTEDTLKIKEIHLKENIYAVSPKIVGFVRIGEKRLPLMGLKFEEELKIKKWWRIKGSIPKSDDEILLGSEASRFLLKREGDSLFINGKKFKIAGVLKTEGSQDDNLIFADLEVAQRILKRKGLSFIDVAAYCYSCPVEEITKEISHVLPHARVTPIRQTIETRMETLSHVKRFSLGISTLILFIAGLIIFSSMMASVNERKREIGIFAAVGFKQGHILEIFLLEALIVGLFGGVLGFLLGFKLSYYLKSLFFSREEIVFVFEPSLALASVGLSILVGTLSSLYPAIKASKTDPTIAFRAL